MDELNTRPPLFKKIDRQVFQSIDKFKTTPNYTVIQDYYNGLEEDQQKLFKAFLNLALLMVPLILLGFLWYGNSQLKKDFDLRRNLLEKALEIIGQRDGLQQIGPRLLSESPIDSPDLLTSRLSNILGGAGVDTGKINVNNSTFVSEAISTTVYRAEGDISFNSMSTEELVNLFTAITQREKFRISSVNITRNDKDLLQGQFHVVHLSQTAPDTGEE